jgi:hypothetical protein
MSSAVDKNALVRQLRDKNFVQPALGHGSESGRLKPRAEWRKGALIAVGKQAPPQRRAQGIGTLQILSLYF